MNFGQALESLKLGSKVAREGWNGRGMWVRLETPDNSNCHEDMKLEPFFVLKNIKDTFNTWVPSVSDILAEDWTIVL